LIAKESALIENHPSLDEKHRAIEENNPAFDEIHSASDDFISGPEDSMPHFEAFTQATSGRTGRAGILVGWS
jgi:hypothetical protein